MIVVGSTSACPDGQKSATIGPLSGNPDRLISPAASLPTGSGRPLTAVPLAELSGAQPVCNSEDSRCSLACRRDLSFIT